MKQILILGMSVLLWSCAFHTTAENLHPNPQPPNVGFIPAIQPFHEDRSLFTLENGLEVLAIHNPSSPMVCLNMTIRAGAAKESIHTSGMTHMLEHLLFNGTENRTQDELYAETDYYGAYSNAYTRKYYTGFFLLLPAEYIENGMDIQSDMMFHSVLPPEKLEKEQGIVMEEIRQGRDSETNAVEHFFNRSNFGGGGLGLPTLGTLSTVKHMTREDIYHFYKTVYVPNNMTLTVIGNFNPDRLRSQLENYYGNEPPGPVAQPGFPMLSSGFEPGRTVNQTSLSTQYLYGQLVYPLPAVDVRTAAAETGLDHIGLRDIILDSFVEFSANRIAEELPEYNGSLYRSGYPGNDWLLLDFKTAPESDAGQVVEELTAAMSKILSGFHSQMTVDRVQGWLKKRRVEEISLLDSPHYYSMMNSADLAKGGQFVLSKLNILENASAASIVEADVIPAVSPVRVNLVHPESGRSSEAAVSEMDYQKSVLPSGLTLITASGGGSEMFGMHILIKNRSLIEGELRGGTEILHSLLTSGTDTYSAEEIQLELDRMGAQTKFTDLGFIPYDDYYNTPEYGYLRWECLEEDAEEGIRFLAHLTDHTVVDEKKLEQGLQEAQMRLAMQKQTARTTASDTFWTLFLGEGHPNTGKVSGTSASLAQITLDNIHLLQKAYFNPANYIVSISSNLSHAQLAAIFNSVWSVQGVPSEPAREPILLPREKQERLIEMDKEQAQIRLGFAFDIDEEDKAAFSLLTSVVSDRMMMDLRETQGLAYSIGLSHGYIDSQAWVLASMGTASNQVDTALAGIGKYLQPNAAEKISQDEITRIINARKGRYMMRTLTRIGQAFYMGYYEFKTGDYRNALNKFDQMEKLTPADLETAAERYLHLPENHTYVLVR